MLATTKSANKPKTSWGGDMTNLKPPLIILQYVHNCRNIPIFHIGMVICALCWNIDTKLPYPSTYHRKSGAIFHTKHEPSVCNLTHLTTFPIQTGVSVEAGNNSQLPHGIISQILMINVAGKN